MKGFGRTPLDAQNEALKQLTRKLTKLLRDRQPPLLAWQPTMDFVKRHLLKDAGKAGENFVAVNEIEPSKTWIYEVKPLDWSLLTALDQEARRAERRRERALLGAEIYGGFALVLAVLTLYYRFIRKTG